MMSVCLLILSTLQDLHINKLLLEILSSLFLSPGHAGVHTFKFTHHHQQDSYSYRAQTKPEALSITLNPNLP